MRNTHLASLGPVKIGSIYAYAEGTCGNNNNMPFLATVSASPYILGEENEAEFYSPFIKAFNTLEESKAFVESHFALPVQKCICWQPPD